MAQVKLTKSELRIQQVRMSQLVKYLPTLQLKKALLQAEVNLTLLERERVFFQFSGMKEKIHRYAKLFSFDQLSDFFTSVEILQLDVSHENIAGVDIPNFENIAFNQFSYSLFDTPVWFDVAIEDVRNILTLREQLRVIEDKKKALEKELREVSIRVNLFEKILIPRAKENIKRIKVFLGDQQLAAVAQAKVSKKKILLRHERAMEEENL